MPKKKKKNNYTGPTWVGPLFKWSGLAAATFILITTIFDTETEYE